MLERTTARTLWWVLGHPVTVVIIGVLFGAGVIAASAIAARSAPVAVDGTTAPASATEAVRPSASTEASITVNCPADARLTVTATGTGLLELTVDGPARAYATGAGTVTATVIGPAGTYTARVTATIRLDTVSWHSTAGACTG